MKPDMQNTNRQGKDPVNEAPTAALAALSWIKGVGDSIFRTTVRFLRNIPSRIRNKYLRYLNEKKRMPKRKTKSKVYVLVGYTNKKYVDRRYAATKVQNLIRKVLLISILLVFLVILYKWLNPLGNTNELKLIIGVDKIDELAQDDPFGATMSSNQLIITTSTPTPTGTAAPSITATPAPT